MRATSAEESTDNHTQTKVKVSLHNETSPSFLGDETSQSPIGNETLHSKEFNPAVLSSNDGIYKDLEAERQRQIEINLLLPPVKQRANIKHVSRACLNCRSRHFKCSGELPSCLKCVKTGTVCTYVQSKRGGSRKRGVSKVDKSKTKNNDQQGSTEIEDLPHRRIDAPGVDPDKDAFYQKPIAGGCSKPGCSGNGCKLKSSVVDANDSEIKINQLRKRPRFEKDGLPKLPNCMCGNGGLDQPPYLPSELEKLNVGISIKDPSNMLEIDANETDVIINKYYEKFHSAHPLLPRKEELKSYFEDESAKLELLYIMQVIVQGQETDIYANNSELISDRLVQCLDLIKKNNSLDIVSLISLLLVSIIAHVSALHDFSKILRQFSIKMIQEFDINKLDAKHDFENKSQLLTPSDSKTSFDNERNNRLYDSDRLRSVSKESISDLARRLFWELIFFDVIIGSADGKTLTNFSSIECEVNYPTYPPAHVFDYKGRAEAAFLVNSAIKLNLAIINKQPLDKHLAPLNARLSTMEMKLSDPPSYNSPLLINKHGVVNEGVHQSILLLNYAKIFVHRPFSYLWKIKSPQVPRCVGGDYNETREFATGLKGDAIAIVETSKTIEAADSIVRVLIDTSATRVLKRTPLFACSLALASLVHLSAYIWIENKLHVSQEEDDNSSFTNDDLSSLAEYIKLSLSAIYPISKHWKLSGRLTKHIRDSLSKLRPGLYSKLKDELPQIESQLKSFGLKAESIDDHAKDSSSNSNSINDNTPNSNFSNHLTNSTPPNQNSTSNSSEDASHYQGFAIDQKERPEYINEFSFYQNEQRQNLVNLNNLLNSDVIPSDINYDVLMETGNISPVSDTGCDWIDKALMDYFEDGNSYS